MESDQEPAERQDVGNQFIFAEEVATDVDSAANWYASHRLGLEVVFLKAIETTVQNIEQFPTGPAILHRGVRVRKLPRFPYEVYYRIDHDSIFVVGILHLQREATIWRDRLG